MKKQRILFALIVTAIWLPVSCKRTHTEREISEQMAKYDRLLEKMNTDSIADLYTENGQLGNVAKGRDSINRFLKTFSNYRVIQNKSTTDSIRILGDSAIQIGSYTQITILPGKDTAHLTGRFRAIWKLAGSNGWKIYRMETSPTAK